MQQTRPRFGTAHLHENVAFFYDIAEELVDRLNAVGTLPTQRLIDAEALYTVAGTIGENDYFGGAACFGVAEMDAWRNAIYDAMIDAAVLGQRVAFIVDALVHGTEGYAAVVGTPEVPDVHTSRFRLSTAAGVFGVAGHHLTAVAVEGDTGWRLITTPSVGDVVEDDDGNAVTVVAVEIGAGELIVRTGTP